MIRHLGYACKNMTLGNKVLTDRTLREARFTLERVDDLALKNSQDLITIMQWNADNGIKFFRIGSGLFPFMDHPKRFYKFEDLKNWPIIAANIAAAGKIAADNGIRLSCHPGPYTCLASPDNLTVIKSVKTIEMHAMLGKMLCLPTDDFVINFHVGGVYGNKQETAKRFINNLNTLLTDWERKHITIENDDKTSMWSISDLVEYGIGNKVRLVLDVHHHRFCHRESLYDAADMAFETWPEDQVPKIHYSESAEGKKPQAHSDYIFDPIPNDLHSRNYDVMIEAKAKELALQGYQRKYQLLHT
jgi:UV DNA damage endonuclease